MSSDKPSRNAPELGSPATSGARTDAASDAPCDEYDASGDSASDFDVALTPDVLAALPVFPLPNCVLLPNGLLPLHIFEPRYRNMTRYCLDHHGMMGIANAQPGTPAGVPATIGVGKIICSEQLPDGRYMLLLRGVARVKVGAELAMQDGYRRFACERIDELQDDRSEALCERLRAVAAEASMRMPSGGEALVSLCDQAAGLAADGVAAACITSPVARQQLLETPSVTARLKVAISTLEALLASLPAMTLN